MSPRHSTNAAKELWELPFSISVVIPAYNESARLPRSLRQVHSFMERHVKDFEIIVVDDGSTDNTVKLAKEIAEPLSSIRVITNSENRGKGSVVRQGLSEAKGDYRLFMDADHSTNVSELLLLPGLIRLGGDVFISSRHLPQSHIEVPQPLVRRVISRIANWKIQLFALPGIQDTQNGFKIFSAKSFITIEPCLKINGWLFDVEMLFMAQKADLKIIEFPIKWTNESVSRLSVRQDLIETGKEFVGFMSNRLLGRYRKSVARGK